MQEQPVRIRSDQKGGIPAMVNTICRGHEDAKSAVNILIETQPAIDPTGESGPIGGTLRLVLGLDAANIWDQKPARLLWNVCEGYPVKALALLRAYQLQRHTGVTFEVLHHAIETNGEGIDLDKIVKIVSEKIETFNPNPD